MASKSRKSTRKVAPKQNELLMRAMKQAKSMERRAQFRQEFMRNFAAKTRRLGLMKRIDKNERSKLKSAMMDTEHELRRSSRLAGATIAKVATAMKKTPAATRKRAANSFIYPSTLVKNTNLSASNVDKAWKKRITQLSKMTRRSVKTAVPKPQTSADKELNAFANTLAKFRL